MTLNRTADATTRLLPSRFVTDSLDISLIAPDTYCLLAPNRTIGFVQKRGNVFVGLLGDDILHTMEVGESLSFDAAVAMVVVGALLGGFIGSAVFGIGLEGFFSIQTWLLAIGGAIVVLLIYGLATRGSRRA